MLFIVWMLVVVDVDVAVAVADEAPEPRQSLLTVNTILVLPSTSTISGLTNLYTNLP